jgi:A/G-specific adenine glycosylase
MEPTRQEPRGSAFPGGSLGTSASPAWRRTLARRMLAWFKKHARDLPWRRTRDLYAIWLSEIMLQQTQVGTVIPYWERFLARFPDVASLAAAEEREVLRLWEGLGYYRRARQLHAAAGRIALEHQGKFPTSYEAVRSLPGIGRYTAGAILSIGRDQRLPILEANTIRVLARLTAYEGDPASTAGQKYLWSVAEQILPANDCGAFNQALMELGSEVCTPKQPVCDSCPVAGLCEAHARGIANQLPRPSRRTNYEDVTEIAVIVRERGRVLVRHCQRGERWAGLWDFPRFAARSEAESPLAAQIAERMRELTGIDIATGSRITTLKHGVTRFRITLHCYEATRLTRATVGPSAATSGSLQWLKLNQLSEYPLSVTGRKIARMLIAPRRKAVGSP